MAKATVKPKKEPAPKPVVESIALAELKLLPNIHKEGAKAEKALIAFVDAMRATLREAREHGDRAAHLVQVYSKCRTAQDILAVPLKAFAEVIAQLQNALIPEAFDREQLQTLTTRDGDRMTITQKLYASILAEKRAEAYEWLRANGHSALIQETVNAGSLSAFAKAELAEGREIPEEIFTVHYAPAASLTRKK